MKLAVVGSRSFNDYDLLSFVLDEYYELSGNNLILVSGGALGADSLAERYSIEWSLPICIFKPDWTRFGKSAGYIRNKDIVNFADEVVAFWDGKSKGTKHTIDLAERQNKTLVVIEYQKLISK